MKKHDVIPVFPVKGSESMVGRYHQKDIFETKNMELCVQANVTAPYKKKCMCLVGFGPMSPV